MVSAYVLILTDAGQAAEVAAAVESIEGVHRADDVTGPYDVIVQAVADDVDELGRLVVSRIQAIDGVARTITCPVVHL